MANVEATLTVSRRWWYWPAFYVGAGAYGLGFISASRAYRYIDWLVGKGLRIEIR